MPLYSVLVLKLSILFFLIISFSFAYSLSSVYLNLLLSHIIFLYFLEVVLSLLTFFWLLHLFLTWTSSQIVFLHIHYLSLLFWTPIWTFPLFYSLASPSLILLSSFHCLFPQTPSGLPKILLSSYILPFKSSKTFFFCIFANFLYTYENTY